MPFFTSHDGVRLFYRVEGPPDGPALIFSNALGADHGLWQAQASALARTFRIVRYDQRGHGASDCAASVAVTIDDLGRDVLALAGALNLPTFSFCGVSMGGATGLWLAAHAPDRIVKLVLANTATSFPPRDVWAERIAAIEAAGMTAIADGVIERWFSPAFREADPPAVAAVRAMVEGTDPRGYVAVCRMLMDLDLTGLLAKVAAPTLVISGSDDPSTPPARGQEIAGGVSDARHAMLPARHISNIEQANAFTLLLAEFLTGHRLPADERYLAGTARRRAALGDAWVDRSIATRTDFNDDFQDLITRYCWGEVWTRPGLDEQTRRIIVIVTCAALSRWEEFDLHFGAALRAGVSPATLKEALIQVAIYAGVPAANTAFARAAAIIRPHRL
jgi:3-oxoadipate enol-lactonase/4-carboxymuconolactone decarboxylase